MQRDRLDILNLKWSSQRGLKYLKSKDHQKKFMSKNPIFNIGQSDYSNFQINAFQLLINQNLLLHLGEEQQPNTSSCLLKLDLESKVISWRLFPYRFEKLMNATIPFGQNSFVNGSYKIDRNISLLNLYDFRVEGPVLRLLRSNS